MKAEIFRYCNWLPETDPDLLKATFQKLLEKSGFSVLSLQEHHFSPVGYTCLWLLGESHFAVHTFPEKQSTYIELSSCNKNMHTCFVAELEKKVMQKSKIELSRPKSLSKV